MRTNPRHFILLAAISFPAAAFAADFPSKTTLPVLSPAPVANWAGFYAGSFVGGSLERFSTRQSASASGAAFGATTGALVGYNWQSGALVYGLEGDLGSNYGAKKFAARPGLVANQIDSIYAIHARARFG
jgi:hypothetical protein